MSFQIPYESNQKDLAIVRGPLPQMQLKLNRKDDFLGCYNTDCCSLFMAKWWWTTSKLKEAVTFLCIEGFEFWIVFERNPYTSEKTLIASQLPANAGILNFHTMGMSSFFFLSIHSIECTTRDVLVVRVRSKTLKGFMGKVWLPF